MAELHEVRPGTPPEVLDRLRDLIGDAQTGNVRGLVVMARFNDERGYVHWTAGDLSVGEILLLMASWQFDQVARRARVVP